MSSSATRLRLGFVALNDCAPLVIAKERGFFRRHGLAVELERQPSWANARDKLQAGLLDAAQMLAPMPLASTLGLDGPPVPMSVPLALGLGGNAITVSRGLWEAMRRVDAGGLADRRRSAQALAAVVRRRRESRAPRLRFGVVFPWSAHLYELLYWAASAGVDPLRDLEIAVHPPASMVERFARGELDGTCVGEPWGQLAVERGLARSVLAKGEIWASAPEKVLSCTRAWIEQRPEAGRALVRALIEAARWLDRPENRLEAAHVIAGESFVDAPVEVVSRGLLGRPRLGEDEVAMPDFHVFHRHAATFPWVSHVAWFATQMLRWGQVEKPIRVRALAADVYCPDLYREAAEEVGEPAPEIDEKCEGEHEGPWLLEAASEPIEMGPDRFLDGRRFDPRRVVDYLEQLPVTRLRARIDDLATWNA